MEIETKILEKGLEKVDIICPNCKNRSSGYFYGKEIGKKIFGFTIESVEENRFCCNDCGTVFKIIFKED